jgi:cardiolipin synthase A/B
MWARGAVIHPGESARRNTPGADCRATAVTIARVLSRVDRAAPVANDALASHGEELAATEGLDRREIALAFEPSWATAPELLVEGANFYPRLQEDMEDAQSSIHVIQFGFKPGTVGDVFAELLERRAREGVAVRLIVDENGSAASGRSRPMFERLARAGAEIVVNVGSKLRAARGPVGGDRGIVWNLRNAGHIDHRKMVIVDGRVGWVGGAGFEDHFADGRFHDLFVRFEGEAASQLQLVFVASFRYHAGRFPAGTEGLFPSPGPRPVDAVDAVVAHNAPGPYRPITTAIRELVESASETLDVVNPYVTDRGTISRLLAAARRGVRVRLVVPAEPNNWACGAAEKHHHPALLSAGVQIAEHPAMVHAKALVRDGHDVLVGTCNLEAWSFKRFYEIDVRFDAPALARSFEDDFFEPAIAVSRAGTVAGTRRERARNAAFAALSPFL